MSTILISTTNHKHKILHSIRLDHIYIVFLNKKKKIKNQKLSV